MAKFFIASHLVLKNLFKFHENPFWWRGGEEKILTDLLHPPFLFKLLRIYCIQSPTEIFQWNFNRLPHASFRNLIFSEEI